MGPAWFLHGAVFCCRLEHEGWDQAWGSCQDAGKPCGSSWGSAWPGKSWKEEFFGVLQSHSDEPEAAKLALREGFVTMLWWLRFEGGDQGGVGLKPSPLWEGTQIHSH